MADKGMEPQSDPRRLGNVRPDPRPAPDHAGHDRWLVVRWTTDPADLTAAETAQARTLLADCAECAALSADLQAISHATATSVVPTRPRDLRLTPQQLDAARGSVLDRVRRWFASPGSFAVRPLAGAALAIGIMLVVVAPGLRSNVTSGSDGVHVANPQAVEATSAAATTLTAKQTEAPAAPDGAGPEMYAGAAEATGDPATGDPATGDPAAGDRSVHADVTLMQASGSPSATAASDTAAVDGRQSSEPGPVAEAAPPAGPDDGATRTGDASMAAMDDTTFALTLLGIVLAGVGLLVLVFAWFARRWQDPLLR